MQADPVGASWLFSSQGLKCRSQHSGLSRLATCEKTDAVEKACHANDGRVVRRERLGGLLNGYS